MVEGEIYQVYMGVYVYFVVEGEFYKVCVCVSMLGEVTQKSNILVITYYCSVRVV